MDYLARDSAPFSEELWAQIDSTVVGAVKETLIGRKFIPLHGPLGAGVGAVQIDQLGHSESFADGFAAMEGRALTQIPQLYEDFWIYWRDIEMTTRAGTVLDLGAVKTAGQAVALREDKMLFYGVSSLGIDGLLSVKGVNSQKRSDWTTGEGAFTDVATGITTLQSKNRIGRHTLLVSQDLYVQLQRIQPGVGVLESDRIGKLLDGPIFTSPILQPKTALLICAQSQYIDLAVGQDFTVGYSETDNNLNHHMRVLETALPRVKSADAIVVFK